MKTFLLLPALLFVFCMGTPVQAAAAEQDGMNAQHERVRHDRPNLTQEQRAQLGNILKAAAPTLKEKRKALRTAERAYSRAVADGRGGQAEKAQAVKAYEDLLDAEAPVRRELKAAGLPADMPLGKRSHDRRAPDGHKPDKRN